MKLLFAAVSVLLLSLCACGQHREPDTEAAKQRFASNLNRFVDEMENNKQTSKGKQAENAMAIMDEFQRIDTAGLPDDLATAFAAVQVQTLRMVELTKAFNPEASSDAAETLTPEQKSAKTGGEAMRSMALLQKLPEAKAKFDEAMLQLEVAAKKHNLDLSKFIKGKG